MHRSFVCIAALIAICLFSTSALGQVAPAIEGMPGDGIADAIYDANNGNITIDPDGTSVGLFQLDSLSGIFGRIADGALPPGGIGFDTLQEARIGWSALPASAITAPWNIGDVATAELAKDVVFADLMTLVGGGLGTPNAALNLIYIPVPEPSALLLIGIALAGCVGLRRRS